ncbi:TPA: hypothetical protein ACQMPF_001643, partial [Streptococcus pyogenes]
DEMELLLLKKKKNILFYLCLALLGVAVLASNPVKAEENGFEKERGTSFQTPAQPLKEILQGDESETKRFPEGYDPEDPQDVGYYEGWEAGSNAPWWTLSPTIDEDRIPNPKREDWLNDQSDLTSYKEGYATGFYGGWYSNHDMVGFVQNTFYWLWNQLNNFLGI